MYELMAPSGDGILDIIDAAYRLDLNTDEWLDGIAQACLPSLDQGFGLCAFTFQFRQVTGPRIGRARMHGMPDGLAGLYPTMFANMDASVKSRPFARGPCTTASQMLGMRAEFKNHPQMRQHAQRFGIMDSIWITAAEPSGCGVGLHAGRAKIAWAPPKLATLWARVGAHLSAAGRLRRRKQAQPLEKQAAVFDLRGRIQHVNAEVQSGQLIDVLREAVLRVQRLRALPGAEQSGKALALWKGLVEARWSVIERFDTDGKRFVVACSNEPAPPSHETLTLRERQVAGYAALGHENKVIAYDLGISHSTVRVLMARAAAKLGARSRHELVELYGRLFGEGHALNQTDRALSVGAQ